MHAMQDAVSDMLGRFLDWSDDVGAGALEDAVEVVCEDGTTGNGPLER